jgi:multimeric flavodoxin WrbA
VEILVVSSSPNHDGLTAACAEAAAEGCRSAGAEVSHVRLNEGNVGLCQACNNGWGACREEHRCQVEDGFQELHRRICEADGFVLVSPVYWGQMSESAKAFTDRLRRCEASAGAESRLKGKAAIAVAAAGGGGGGLVTCLMEMERLVQHVRARRYDLVGVTRWTRDVKLPVIRATSEAMVTGWLGQPA